MRLSEVFIKSIKPAIKAKKYADGDGLFLFVSISGVKSWRLRYRDITGAEKEMTLGLYPTVSLADARDKRYKARKLLSQGKDPIAEKKEQRLTAIYNASNSFEAVAKEWLELNKGNWSEKYSKKVENRFKTYVFAAVGNKPISEVTGLEILNLIRKIEHKGNTETSHKLLQNCIAVFRLAVLTNRVKYNPLSDLKGVLKPHKAKSLPAVSIDDLPDLFQALDVHHAPEIDKIAVRLLCYMFTRTCELRKAKKSEFDFKKALWIVPADRMKMRREHLVPLSRQSIALLKRAFKITNEEEYVFPTKNFSKYPYMNENVINKLLKDMKYQKRHSGHGFRSLASTSLNELSWYHPQIIEKQLAHEEKNKVRAAYNRAQYLPQRTELMQRWADYVDQIIADHQANQQKNVT